ncbi:efflux RND transporter periplasmic adaptor subunit [Candidatus Woesebacteria bacterium]|nr:efflux RND transporter periplasmic adaptor subunit [Candidatus Woesebacteria bacterium]
MKEKTRSLVKKLKARWKLLLVMLLVGGGLVLYFFNKAQANQETYTFISPERGEITQSIELSGTVDAKERARLRFAAGGKVTYLGAQEGDAVKKWQTIATIDQAALQKQLEQTLNNYSKERWDWEQTQDDIDHDYAGQPLEDRRTIDKEQFDLNNSVLTVEIQDIAIQNTRLTAPFNGVLTTSPATVTGVQLLASDYFEIINPETIIFRAYVEEEDVTKLSLDQVANIRLDAFSEGSLNSTISYISYTALQGVDGTVFMVEFPLAETEDMPLRIGMNGDAEVILSQKEDVLYIPIIATIQRDDKTFVEVKVDENKVEEREIETGIESEEYIEVISGLSESDLIVLPE